MSQSQTLWSIPAPVTDETALTHRARSLQERLLHIASRHNDVRFASSMAVEDMVVIDAIARAGAAVSIFTLDTLRLHPQSVDMIDRASHHYGLEIQRFTPQPSAVEHYVQTWGVNGFYDSVEAKEKCCHVRKVQLLADALKGASAWVTGQRSGQGVTRAVLSLQEFDTQRGIDKYNPIHDWTEDDVWAYIHHYGVPFNPLYREGYASIGCDPCTRPIRQGESVRAGRWWWLQESSKECGLHVNR